MQLTDLPDDIFLHVIQFLPYQSDFNALLQANTYLHALLNPLLYRHNVKHSGSSALLWAAKQGNASTARRMLDEGASLDAGVQNPRCLPITVAIKGGHDSILSLFLARGLDLRSPGTAASSCGYLSNYLFNEAVAHGQESLAREFLPYRVVFTDVESNQHCECCAYSIHHAACEGFIPLVKLLVGLGYDINAGDEYSDTPLIHAASNGHHDVVSFLVECGANLDQEGSYGTALAAAAEENHFDIVKTLVEAGARPDPAPISANTTLMAVARAAEPLHLDIARYLLDHIETDQKIVETGDDPHLLLRVAALCGMTGIIEKFLTSGDAIVDKLKEDGNSSYFGAGWGAALSLAAQSGNLESMKLLLDNDPPNVRKNIGKALETAINYHAVEKTKLLLDYGADPNTKDYLGHGLLKLAFGNEEIFKMLLDNGASLESAQEKAEDNILVQIIESGNIGSLKILMGRGVQLQLPRRTGTSLLKSGVRGGEKMMQFLFDNGMCIPPPCKMVDQCMAMAARDGQLAALQLLLDHGYSPDTDARRAKLLKVASDGQTDNSNSTIDLLIRYGVHLEARNKQGEPALWCHVRGGHEKAVQLLLDKGADALSRNHSSESLLKIAAQSGNSGVVKSLLRAVSLRGIPWTEIEDAWLQASSEARGVFPRVTRELDVFYCRTMYPVA